MHSASGVCVCVCVCVCCGSPIHSHIASYCCCLLFCGPFIIWPFVHEFVAKLISIECCQDCALEIFPGEHSRLNNTNYWCILERTAEYRSHKSLSNQTQLGYIGLFLSVNRYIVFIFVSQKLARNSKIIKQEEKKIRREREREERKRKWY